MKRKLFNNNAGNNPNNEPAVHRQRKPRLFGNNDANTSATPAGIGSMGLNFGAPPASFRNNLNIPEYKEDEGNEVIYRNNVMYPIVPNSVPAPSLLFKCMKYGDQYVYLKKPEVETAYNSIPVEQYNSMQELLENPGIYTWILMENGNFIARKAFTPAEVFSKHLNIYRPHFRSGIIAAGECLIHEEKRVEFNLMSGTYMNRIREQYERRFHKNYEDLYVPHIEKLWRDAGATNVVHVGIHGLLPAMVSDTDLQPYLNIGFQKQTFADEHSCKAVENEEFEKEQNAQLGIQGGRGSTRRSKRKSRRLRRKYKSRRNRF